MRLRDPEASQVPTCSADHISLIMTGNVGVYFTIRKQQIPIFLLNLIHSLFAEVSKETAGCGMSLRSYSQQEYAAMMFQLVSQLPKRRRILKMATVKWSSRR